MKKTIDIADMNKLSEVNFKKRRQTFLKKIKGAVALFPAPPAAVRNNDVFHPYRQDSNFYYLTGFNEPDSFCILTPESKTPFQLFVQPRNKKKEMWEGPIWGPKGAEEKFGADAAHPSTTDGPFEDIFVDLLSTVDRLYYRVGVNPNLDQRVFSLMERARSKMGRKGRPMWPILDPDDILGEMRLVKDKQEIDRLQVACDITAQAHINAMRAAKPGMYEYEIEARLFHDFRTLGAERLGYGSIVAGGANACVLHYHENDSVLKKNDLLLIDAGAEFQYYSSDITRTFPVGGRYTKEQAEIYDAVLDSQQEAIKMAKPGTTLEAIHERATEVLIEHLRRLKVLKGTKASILKDESYRDFYPHRTGHWLGMDVHDVGKYYSKDLGSHRKLEPGMVFTIEPGLYFAKDKKSPNKYRGIGVRIEDDILITKKGCQVLTAKAPKDRDEIEEVVNS